MSQVYAVQIRTFELNPKDEFVFIDAPDELAARMAASKASPILYPETHQLLRLVGEIVPMGNEVKPGAVHVVVDRNGDKIEVEVV